MKKKKGGLEKSRKPRWMRENFSFDDVKRNEARGKKKSRWFYNQEE